MVWREAAVGAMARGSNALLSVSLSLTLSIWVKRAPKNEALSEIYKRNSDGIFRMNKRVIFLDGSLMDFSVRMFKKNLNFPTEKSIGIPLEFSTEYSVGK